MYKIVYYQFPSDCMKSLTESALIISELHQCNFSRFVTQGPGIGIEGANNNAVNVASFSVEVSVWQNPLGQQFKSITSVTSRTPTVCTT